MTEKRQVWRHGYVVQLLDGRMYIALEPEAARELQLEVNERVLVTAGGHHNVPPRRSTEVK